MASNMESGIIAQKNDETQLYDAQKVPQPAYDPYFNEHNHQIICDLLKDQKRYHSRAGFCNTDGPIPLNTWMRETLISWLRDVCGHRKCEQEVLALAAQMVDRYLNAKEVAKGEYQLVGATCLFMASKIKETIPISVDRVVQYTDFSITKQDVLAMEVLVGSYLNWDLSGVTPMDFFMPLCNQIQRSKEIEKKLRLAAIDIYMKCAHACSLCDYFPSFVAVACVILASQTAFNSHDFMMHVVRIVPVVAGTDAKTLMDCYNEVQRVFQQQQQKKTDSSSSERPPAGKPEGKTAHDSNTPTDMRDVRF